MINYCKEENTTCNECELSHMGKYGLDCMNKPIRKDVKSMEGKVFNNLLGETLQDIFESEVEDRIEFEALCKEGGLNGKIIRNNGAEGVCGMRGIIRNRKSSVRHASERQIR